MHEMKEVHLSFSICRCFVWYKITPILSMFYLQVEFDITVICLLCDLSTTWNMNCG